MHFKVIIVILNFSLSLAQQTPLFKSLRYKDDFSYLKTDTLKSDYDKLKFTPLNNSKTAYISFGGEVRFQYFNIKNEEWGDVPDDQDGYILSRYLAHADFQTSHFRLFFQLQSSNANSRINPNVIENNPLDIHQAFLDLTISPDKKEKLLFRVGRQELSYGSQRLIAVREVPNSRLAFDGMKIIWNKKDIKSDLFYAFPVINQSKIMDDHLNSDTKFWGSYTVINQSPILSNIDVYYLGLYKNKVVYDDGSGKETRHSTGLRIWENSGNWNYDFEGVFQFGKVGDLNSKAWTISSNTSYQFKNIKYSPKVGLKSEIISGNKSYNDKSIETFNPLFPKGAYFGQAALIGPSNLFDIHPSIDFEIHPKIVWIIDYDAFWRFSKNDGIYAPNTQLIYTGKESKEKFIGSQFTTEFIYQHSAHLLLKAEATYFNAGKFIEESGTGKNTVVGVITTQFKF